MQLNLGLHFARIAVLGFTVVMKLKQLSGIVLENGSGPEIILAYVEGSDALITIPV